MTELLHSYSQPDIFITLTKLDFTSGRFLTAPTYEEMKAGMQGEVKAAKDEITILVCCNCLQMVKK